MGKECGGADACSLGDMAEVEDACGELGSLSLKPGVDSAGAVLMDNTGVKYGTSESGLHRGTYELQAGSGDEFAVERSWKRRSKVGVREENEG